MRRRYGAYAALLAIFILLFSGCDALIGNVFKEANWGQPSAEKLKSADTAALLEESGGSSGSGSSTFIDTVLSDDDTKTTVMAKLEATATDPDSTPEEVQQSQTLLISIKLADYGADDIVTNITESAGSVIEQLSNQMDEGGNVDFAAIIDVLLPDTNNLADIINNLGTMTSDYDNLAANISTNGSTLDPDVVASAAQTALLAEIVSDATPNTSNYDTVGEAMAALVEDIKNSEDPSSIDMNQYIQPSPDMSALTAEGTTLYTLFNEAGMGDVLAQLSGIGS